MLDLTKLAETTVKSLRALADGLEIELPKKASKVELAEIIATALAPAPIVKRSAGRASSYAGKVLSVNPLLFPEGIPEEHTAGTIEHYNPRGKTGESFVSFEIILAGGKEGVKYEDAVVEYLKQ